MKHKISLVLASLAMVFSCGLIGGVHSNKEVVEPAEAAVDINDYTACETAHNSGSASNLLTALRNITSPGQAGSYNDLWTTYTKAYVRADGKIFDYYSSITNYVPGGSAQGASYSKEGDSYNREHSIPKSWWGGAQTNQGADPFIVVPTDGYVNNGRSNFSFGMVQTASKTYSNSKLGTGNSSYISGTVFEPDDSVKGDFARIYFYAIAKYSASYGWTSGDGSKNFSGNANTNYGLTTNAVKLFSYWSNLDPVSDWERSVNDNIAPIQGNRNPFIDHPEYANTLWGNVSGYTTYTHATPSIGITSISKTSASLAAGDTTTINAVSSNSGTISWSSSNTSIATVSNATAASGSNVTITGVAQGSATITASITISGTTYTKTCSVTVTAAKSLSSIAVSNAKTSYVVDDTFVKPTVTATFSDSSTDDVKDSAVFSGYDLSQAGNQTVSVSYTYKGVQRTTSYQITVSESGGTDPVSGDSETIVMSEQEYTSGGSVSSASGSNCTITFSQNSGSNGPKYYDSGSAVRLYPKNTMTVASNGNNIIEITLTFGSGEGSNTITVNTGSFSSPTWTGTSMSVTFTVNGSSNHRRIASVTIVYESSGSSDPVLSTISVSTAPTKTTYIVGEYFDPTGLVITRTYSDSSTDTYAYAGHSSEFTFIPSTSTPLTFEDESIEVIYGGESCFFEIELTAAKELSSISVSGYTASFAEGDKFIFGGTVTAHYADASTENVTSSATFSGYDMTTVSNQTVTVTYQSQTTTYQIAVSAGTLNSITVSGQTTTYTRNASFSFDGTCTATFTNGYQKEVTPTSVTSPDMTTAGSKTITVIYTYNGNTRTTSYNISVNTYRTVIEESYSLIGTISYTSGSEVISVNTLSTSKSGYTNIENGPDTANKAIRLGSGSNKGTLTITSTTSNIRKVVVNARTYNTDSPVNMTIGGTSNSLTTSYADYTKEYTTATNSCAIATTTNGKRAWIKSVTVYTYSTQDIGQTEDCVGLETFINNYMHMDYTENLGYCNDNEHHYYSTAKTAFNALNSHQRSLFTGNSAYTVEWTRLSTWASKNGDSLNNSNQLVAGANPNPVSIIVGNGGNIVAIITVVALISIASIGGYFFIKKRKEI